MALEHRSNAGEDSPAGENKPSDLELSPREQAIALGLSQGLSDREIALAIGGWADELPLEIQSCMLKIGLSADERACLRPLRVESKR